MTTEREQLTYFDVPHDEASFLRWARDHKIGPYCPGVTSYSVIATLGVCRWAWQEATARAALAQPAQPVAKKIDMHSLRVLANAMHKVAPHVVDEFINCAVEALSKESEHDNQSDSGCTRGMAGEGNQDGACTGSDVSRTGIGGSGASERESGLLRSRAPEDTGGGNAEGIAAPQPAPAQETKV